MNTLIILSHLMSSSLELSSESKSRAILAIKLSKEFEFKNIITSGWSYRADVDIPICNVMKNFLLQNSSITSKTILVNDQARDTVGDAYFCSIMQELEKVKCIHVVTSDYHVERAKVIFSEIFRGRAKVAVHGSKTSHATRKEKHSHEKNSLNSFWETFRETNLSNSEEIYNTLREKHPFYNGDMYPNI